MINRNLYRIVLSASLVALVALPACDNAVEDDHDEHAEAHGARLTLSGVNIFQVLGGEVSCAVEPCGLQMSIGELTDLITVTFLDQTGTVIAESALSGSEYSLGHDFEHDGIAVFEKHGEDGRWGFHIRSEADGTTGFQIKLLHGSHADFTTPPVSDAKAMQITVAE